MLDLHPQYIKDNDGKDSVILSVEEFNAILEELNDSEYVRLYDEAKREDDGERISMEDAFKRIEFSRNI